MLESAVLRRIEGKHLLECLAERKRVGKSHPFGNLRQRHALPAEKPRRQKHTPPGDETARRDAERFDELPLQFGDGTAVEPRDVIERQRSVKMSVDIIQQRQKLRILRTEHLIFRAEGTAAQNPVQQFVQQRAPANSASQLPVPATMKCLSMRRENTCGMTG